MTTATTDRLETLHAELERGVSALIDSDAWQAWLKIAATDKFLSYSFNNQILIMLQTDGKATHVAGFKAWQAIGRQVRKGERSIGILAPNTRKVKDEITGEESRRITGFRVASVFDISQTDGEPLPERPRPVLLEGQAPQGLWDALESIATGNGYNVTRENCNGANGVTIPSMRAIMVRPDVSDAQACKTLAHEIAHMMLHTDGDNLTITHRGIGEVEAESVAYIVGNVHGIDTGGYSMPYVAGWGEDAAVITATASRVLKTARDILKVTSPEG